jgi:hypothetical protein
MEEVGSFEYAKKVLDGLKNEILEEIKQFGGNNILEGIMFCLTFNFLIY